MHQFWKLGYMSFNTFFERNMYVPDIKTSWTTYLRHYDLEVTLNLEILLLIILGNYLIRVDATDFDDQSSNISSGPVFGITFPYACYRHSALLSVISRKTPIEFSLLLRFILG